jgi:hypothetical protein
VCPSDGGGGGGGGEGIVEADRLRSKHYEPFHGVLRQHQHQQHLSAVDTFSTYCPVHSSATPPGGGLYECRLPLQGFSCVTAATLPASNVSPAFDAQSAAVISSASSSIDVRSTVDWLTNFGERRVIATTDPVVDPDVKDPVNGDWWTRECDCSAPPTAMPANWRRHVAVVSDRDRFASQSSSPSSKGIRTNNDCGDVLSSLSESLRHVQSLVGQSSPLTTANDLEVLSNSVSPPVSSMTAAVLPTVSAEVGNGARPDLVVTPGGATVN